MKKGFTLIELMGVIIIVGMVGLLVIPTVDNVMRTSKQDTYQIQLKTIREGAKNWATDHIESLPEKEGEKITLQLGQLKQAGKVDKNIKNPLQNKPFPDDLLITITYHNGLYLYEVLEDSGTESFIYENRDYMPTIVLNGSPREEIGLETVYEDKGVQAYNTAGMTLEQVEVVIKQGTNQVPMIDTSHVGTYQIEYRVTDSGFTVSASRTVVVKDMTPPILTIPADTVISTTTTSYNLMEGVSATDNSGETVKIVVSGNLSLGIPGRYLIQYTATDSAKNKTTKNRVITIEDGR